MAEATHPLETGTMKENIALLLVNVARILKILDGNSHPGLVKTVDEHTHYLKDIRVDIDQQEQRLKEEIENRIAGVKKDVDKHLQEDADRRKESRENWNKIWITVVCGVVIQIILTALR